MQPIRNRLILAALGLALAAPLAAQDATAPAADAPRRAGGTGARPQAPAAPAPRRRRAPAAPRPRRRRAGRPGRGAAAPAGGGGARRRRRPSPR